MKRTFRLLLLVGVAVALATPLPAQQRLELTSASPHGSVTGWGVYVGPYRGMLVNEPGTPSLDMFCVDFNNAISVGQQWDANFWNLAGDLSGTRFGAMYQAAARLMYRKAAWLASQMDTENLANKSEWKYIHAAMWHTMTCASGTCAPSAAVGNADVQHWLNMADDVQNYGTINLAEWSVVTDVSTVNGVGGVQEYLTRNVVPEPETILLLGTGLLIIGIGVLRGRPFG